MNVESFTRKLESWHTSNPRPMPWLEAKDPYVIWISEIILQQTRVSQGWVYFERFMERFPTLHAVYSGGEGEVLKYWEGLGYYSRARNLYRCAVELVENNGGIFPSTQDELMKLPGIGPYTASAIASFAFEKPTAVMDGNVFRVVTRLLSIPGSPDDASARKRVKSWVDEAIHLAKPSAFNQAMMNFGAMVCTPLAPKCDDCPFQKSCRAFLQNRVNEYPGKKIKPPKKIRHFHYFILVDEQSGHICLQKREDRDIWKNLYEFPLLETVDQGLPDNFHTLLRKYQLKGDKSRKPPLLKYQKQQLSHQEIHFYFYLIYVREKANGTYWADSRKLSHYPMPVTLKKIWNELMPGSQTTHRP